MRSLCNVWLAIAGAFAPVAVDSVVMPRVAQAAPGAVRATSMGSQSAVHGLHISAHKGKTRFRPAKHANSSSRVRHAQPKSTWQQAFVVDATASLPQASPTVESAMSAVQGAPIADGQYAEALVRLADLRMLQTPAPTAALPATIAPTITAMPSAAPAAAPAAPTVPPPIAVPSTPVPDEDSPPYFSGPLKIFVYGFFFAILYLAVWFARLPPDRRPAAVDEAVMRWVESQEEQDPTGAVNCALVKIKSCTGLPDNFKPACCAIEVKVYKTAMEMGQTEAEGTCQWDACFVVPMLDQEQGRPVTMATAKPQVRFILRAQQPGQSKLESFAEAVLKPAADAASSSSSVAAGGATGLSPGTWCITDLKLVAWGTGVTGMFKRLGGQPLGELSVEVKALKVNAAGRAYLRSSYYTAALRNEFKKPWSACGRTLAVAVMGMLALTSAPFIGDMFSGCFYLSCHGLSAATTLLCMSVPHWMKLFNLPVPRWLDAMSIESLKVAGSMLTSAGSSGIAMCFGWNAGEPCTSHFVMLEFLLLLDGLLFTYAWFRGEGGGLMGLLNG